MFVCRNRIFITVQIYLTWRQLILHLFITLTLQIILKITQENFDIYFQYDNLKMTE